MRLGDGKLQNRNGRGDKYQYGDEGVEDQQREFRARLADVIFNHNLKANAHMVHASPDCHQNEGGVDRLPDPRNRTVISTPDRPDQGDQNPWRKDQ